MEDRQLYKTEKLGNYILDIAAGPFGSNLKVDCFVPDGFPIIDGANLKDFKVTDNVTKFVTEKKARSLHRSIAKRNDVIVTISGTVGQISYIPKDSKYEEYLVSQRQFRVTFDDKRVYVPYLVYYFHTKEGQHKILSFANQTGVPALAQPLKNFRNIDISLPDISNQKRIAAILESIDNKIALNNRINHNLEEQAQALYKSWFVDFEPFKDRKFIDSELGMIPAGWHVGSIYDIANIYYGAPFNSALFNAENKGVPLIRIRDLAKQEAGVYTEEIHPKGRLSSKGDILVGMDGEFSAYIWGGENSWINQRITLFEPHSGVGHFFLIETIRPQLKAVELSEVATTVIHIGKSDYDKFKALIPEKTVLEKFRSLTEPLYEQYVGNLSNARSLASTRDILLPKLMSEEC